MSENVGFVEISNDCTIRRNDETPIETFPSGAVRYPTGRRYDLMSPFAVEISQLEQKYITVLIKSLLDLRFDMHVSQERNEMLCMELHCSLLNAIHKSPIEVLDLYAQSLDEGSKKYGDRNWEKGIPESNLVNHAIGHAIKIDVGDTCEDHVSHLIWNVFAIIHFRLKGENDED